MSWRFARWTVEHALPFGASEHARVGDRIAAGTTLAAGTAVRSAVRVTGARTLGVAPADLPRVTRVAVGAEVARGTVLARTGRRFARAVTAPFTGRVVHLSAEGDFWLAPVVERWLVRSTMTGEVVRATDATVVVEGRAWSLGGIAAYGPDAVGELVIGVGGAREELSPQRIDVRLRDRILVGGARVAAEAVTRAHACGVAGLVAGAVPAGGLRTVYGDDVAAAGGTSREDRPTVLCLAGFGAGPLPPEIFGPLGVLAGSLAAIHVASARLFVFAPEDVGDLAHDPPALVLAGDFGSVHPLAGPLSAVEHARFASEHEGPGIAGADGTVPRANVLPFDAAR